MKYNNLFISLCLLLAQVISHNCRAQQIDLPESTIGKIATAFFEAFNVEDESLMEEFTLKYRTTSALKRLPIESRMAQHKQIKGMIKDMSPRKVTLQSEKELTVLVFSEALQSWFECSFGLSHTEAGKLEKFGLKPATAPSEDEGFGEWNSLEELLQNAIVKHDIPGLSMAVIENGQITETAVAGLRRVDGHDKVQLTDRFHIGSITKSMTATLIAGLIEKGKLKPESTLKELLPEIDMLPVYESVTVTQLLHHRGGIAPYLTVTDEQEAKLLGLPGSAPEQRLAFAKQVLMEEPASEPGTAFVYSNAGYSLLGTIAEKLTGKAWTELIQLEIFDPLDMNTAGTDWPRTASRPNQPAGHFDPLGAPRVQRIDEYELGAYIEPAGDVHASMQDLARYALAHMNGLNGKNGLLKPGSFQWLHSPEAGQNYAAGWFISTSEAGVKLHEHSGSAGTFLAMMMIEPENNRGWVIAANAGGMVLDGILRKVIAAWKSK